ncbi:MAG: hypothetical protein ACXVZZ_04040 [Terriglobales bacterium]
MLDSFRRNLVVALLAAASFFMLLIIVQQGHTIDSQRALIRQLFRDSIELNAMKMRKMQDAVSH